MIDERALTKIITAAHLKPGDRVLEIGGGTGILTQKLLQKGADVLTIEKDSRLALILHERFDQARKIGQLKIIQADFLDVPFPETLERLGWKNGRYKVTANLPYQITSPAIERLLERKFLPQMTVLTVQKEVAERICARPGNLSSLAVLVQACARKFTLAAKFPPGNFYPSPEVDSALLKLENIAYPEGIEIKKLRRVIQVGFSQKRKKLKKNLQNVFDKNKIEKIWKQLVLPENVRAQELEIPHWISIASNL